jgi:hypothetical protein
MLFSTKAALATGALIAGGLGLVAAHHRAEPGRAARMGLSCPAWEVREALALTASITEREELAAHYVRTGACVRQPGPPQSLD